MKTKYYYIGKLARICTRQKNTEKKFKVNDCRRMLTPKAECAINKCIEFKEFLNEKDAQEFSRIQAEMESCLNEEYFEISEADKIRNFNEGFHLGDASGAGKLYLALFLSVILGGILGGVQFYKNLNILMNDLCDSWVRSSRCEMVSSVLNWEPLREKFLLYVNDEDINTPEMLAVLMDSGYHPSVQTAANWCSQTQMLETYLNHGGNAKGIYDSKPLFFYASSPDIMKMILEHGEDVNVRQETGENALFYAVNPEQVTWLKEAGIDFNCKNGDGITAMEYVLTQNSGNPSVITAFLQNIPDLQISCSNGNLLILETFNTPEFLQVFIDRKYDFTLPGDAQETLLHRVQNAESVPLLISAGLDVNSKNRDGNTPLHFAADSEMKRVLLENGADFTAENNAGETPLEFQLAEGAAVMQQIESIEEPSERREILSRNMVSVEKSLNAINDFIDCGCNVMPVFRKMISNHKNVIPLFCSSKVNFSQLGEDGNTFVQNLFQDLMLETSKNAEDARIKIQSAGSEDEENRIYDETIKKRTEIELYYSDSIARVIQGGADINQQNEDGNTLLHYSVSDYLPIITKLALSLGANPNIQNHQGIVPLHISSRKTLLQISVSKNSWFQEKNKTYERSEVHDVETAQLLLENGAKVDVKDNEGNTPLHYAAAADFMDVMEILLSGAHLSENQVMILDVPDVPSAGTEADSSDSASDSASNSASNSGDSAVLSGDSAETSEAGTARFRNHDGVSPIMMARSHMMIILLENAGFDARETAENGCNILMGVVSGGNLKLTQEILDRGIPFF